MQPPVIILGHTSFIGKRLFEDFREKGIPVLGASSNECNLLNKASVREFFRKAPEGSRLVFCSVINREQCGAIESLHRNIEMAANAADALEEGRVSSVVYLSSTDIYGPAPALPVTEASPADPSGYYALSKYNAERLLIEKCAAIPLSILRLPGIYGIGDNGRSMVGSFLIKLRNGNPVELKRNGTLQRDYVDVRDICRVVETLASAPQNGVFNIATGRSFLMKEIAETAAEALGVKPQIVLKDEDAGGRGDLVFDTARLEESFSFRFVPLDEGIRHYACAMNGSEAD